MEKRLILLGFLRAHEMHGYQLGEILGQSVGVPVKLTKPNAYKLLNKMEQEGWVNPREEQEGNRPPRRVYSITEEGEKAFQQMLRDSLAEFEVPEFPSVVGLDYLELLPAAEAVELLQQRREKIAAHADEFSSIPKDILAVHPSAMYLLRFYQAEIEWVDEIMGQLTKDG